MQVLLELARSGSMDHSPPRQPREAGGVAEPPGDTYAPLLWSRITAKEPNDERGPRGHRQELRNRSDQLRRPSPDRLLGPLVRSVPRDRPSRRRARPRVFGQAEGREDERRRQPPHALPL